MNTNAHENAVNQMGSFFAGLLVGGLSGAGAMLLFAPQSGKTTRAQIQRKSIELGKQPINAVEDILTQARSNARKINSVLHDQADAPGQRRQVLIQAKG